MRDCSIGALGQESLVIRAIIIVLGGLRDVDAINCNVTLDREWRKLLATAV